MAANFWQGLLEKGLRHDHPLVRADAVRLVDRLEMKRYAPDLRRFLRDDDQAVRYASAVALTRMGDSQGRTYLLTLLDSRDARMASDAAQAVRDLRVTEAIPVLHAELPHASLEIRAVFLGTLVVLGDKKALDIARAESEHANEIKRVGAITAMAAGNSGDDREFLRKAILREGARVFRGVSEGLSWAPDPDPELVKEMIRMAQRPGALLDIALRIGAPLVPFIEKELAEEKRDERVVGLVTFLWRMGTVEAREALLRTRKIHRRLAGEALRFLDLYWRQQGIGDVNVGHRFRLSQSSDAVREGVRSFLTEECGYELVEESPQSILFRRGSRMKRALSLRIENWPTRLSVGLYEAGTEGTGIVLGYTIDTGIHLVGTLERSIIEAEAALLQRFLTTKERFALAPAVAPTRRPVAIAVMMNATLAVVVVAVIGLMAGYPPLTVGVVALLVGVLDAITITAFADLLVEGARKLPRVTGASAPSASEET